MLICEAIVWTCGKSHHFRPSRLSVFSLLISCATSSSDRSSASKEKKNEFVYWEEICDRGNRALLTTMCLTLPDRYGNQVTAGCRRSEPEHFRIVRATMQAMRPFWTAGLRRARSGGAGSAPVSVFRVPLSTAAEETEQDQKAAFPPGNPATFVDERRQWRKSVSHLRKKVPIMFAMVLSLSLSRARARVRAHLPTYPPLAPMQYAEEQQMVRDEEAKAREELAAKVRQAKAERQALKLKRSAETRIRVAAERKRTAERFEERRTFTDTVRRKRETDMQKRLAAMVRVWGEKLVPAIRLSFPCSRPTPIPGTPEP